MVEWIVEEEKINFELKQKKNKMKFDDRQGE